MDVPLNPRGGVPTPTTPDCSVAVWKGEYRGSRVYLNIPTIAETTTSLRNCFHLPTG